MSRVKQPLPSILLNAVNRVMQKAYRSGMEIVLEGEKTNHS